MVKSEKKSAVVPDVETVTVELGIQEAEENPKIHLSNANQN